MNKLTIIFQDGGSSGVIMTVENNETYKTLLKNKLGEEELQSLKEIDLSDDEIFNALLTNEFINTTDKMYNFMIDNNLKWDSQVTLIRKEINDEDIFIKPEGNDLKELLNNIEYSKHYNRQVFGSVNKESSELHIGIIANDKFILFSRNRDTDKQEIQDLEYCYITNQLLYHRQSIMEHIRERCNWLTRIQISKDIEYQMKGE